uniref:DC1 domain-containing protein n=1 Tax=Solanum lycopersicum TaxID=4081 RepID=A0A3Q7J9B4_SOLLC
MKHFSHPHDLRTIEVPSENLTKSKTCFGCNLPLFGSCYTCSSCNFYLHKSCSNLPQSTLNKFHEKHPLRLLYPPNCTTAPCHLCGTSCSPTFTYNCSLCNFNIHANCAHLYETKSRDDNEHYVLSFFKKKLNELKTAKSEIDSAKTLINSLKDEMSGQAKLVRQKKEAAVLQQQENEMILQQRRNNLLLQCMKNSSDSIDFMGQIGTSSNYKIYRY